MKVFDSKTNALLVLVAFLALVTVLIAAAAWGQFLFRDFLDFLKFIIGGGVIRAATNDGIPRAVQAYQAPETLRPPQPPMVNPNGRSTMGGGNIP